MKIGKCLITWSSWRYWRLLCFWDIPEKIVFKWMIMIGPIDIRRFRQ